MRIYWGLRFTGLARVSPALSRVGIVLWYIVISFEIEKHHAFLVVLICKLIKILYLLQITAFQ